MRTKRTLGTLCPIAILGLACAACGGGGGGDARDSDPLAGEWVVATSFTPDAPLGGSCPVSPLDGALLRFEACAPCAGDPDLDGCDGHCTVYFGSSASISRGELGAIHDTDPAFPLFELAFDGTFYSPSEDLTFDTSIGLPEYSGTVGEENESWAVSIECRLYAGDVLVVDPDDPDDLVVDPSVEAFPTCTGILTLSATRPGATLALAGADGEPAALYRGRFLPHGAAPREMRLERSPEGVLVALRDAGAAHEELVLQAPLAASGRFGLELVDGAGRIAIDGLLDGSDEAVGRLVLERGGTRLEGRFLLLAE
jgi:hypothetical protein